MWLEFFDMINTTIDWSDSEQNNFNGKTNKDKLKNFLIKRKETTMKFVNIFAHIIKRDDNKTKL